MIQFLRCTPLITDEQLLLLQARWFFTLWLNIALIRATAGEPLRSSRETGALWGFFLAFYVHNPVGVGNRKAAHFIPLNAYRMKILPAI